jgi:shikimate dehydrogenase
MLDLYLTRDINEHTKIYALLGNPLQTPLIPSIFNKAFVEEKINAVCVPFHTDALAPFFGMAEELPISGITVGSPYKVDVLPYCKSVSETVTRVGAANCMVRQEGWWAGENTESPSLANVLHDAMRKNKGVHAAIIGAGGSARAAAAELARFKARILVLNKIPLQAKRIAAAYKAAWGGLDSDGVELLDRYRGLIILAAPIREVQNEDDTEASFFTEFKFNGHEVIIDLDTENENLELVQRAKEAGCKVIYGRDLLIEQIAAQYSLFMGKEFSQTALQRLKEA